MIVTPTVDGQNRYDSSAGSMGSRFLGGELETLVYPQGDSWEQITLAFWVEVLPAREPPYVSELY